MLRLLPILIVSFLASTCGSIPYKEHLDRKSRTKHTGYPYKDFVDGKLKQGIDTVILYSYGGGYVGSFTEYVVWKEKGTGYKKIFYSKVSMQKDNRVKEVWYEIKPYEINVSNLINLVGELRLDTVTSLPEKRENGLRSNDHQYSNYTLFMGGQKFEFGDYFYLDGEVDTMHPKMQMMKALKQLLK